MSAVKIIQAYAKKSLTKNQGSGITTLPSQFMAESKAGEIAAILQQAGMPLQQLDNFIRSEADLVKFLNIIKNAKPVSTSETSSGVVLPFKQKRSFAEEIDAMKKSGDIVDVDDIKISEKITDREMFKNSNLNKPTVEAIMDRINNANNRINEIKKEQAEMYRPKTDAEIKAKFERQNKEAAERLRKKQKEAMDDMKEIEDPEEFAKGGRIGFRAGKFVLDKVIANLLGNKKKVQQAVDDIFPTGDYKYDADMAADALVENNPQIFKNLLREDLSDEVSSEIYGAVLKPIMSNMAKMRELRKATKPEKTLASMKEGKGIDMSNPEIADEFGRFMKETDPEGYKKLEQTVELSNFDPKKVKGNAEGGRIGYYTGGITDVEPSLDDIGHGADALNSRTRLMSPGSQTTTSTGLNYLLAEDNDNLRVPFSTGKLAGGINSAIEKNKNLEERIARNKRMTDMLNKMYDERAIKSQPEGVLMDPPPQKNSILSLGEEGTEQDGGAYGPLSDAYSNTIVFDDGTVYYKDTGEYYNDEGGQVPGPSKGAKIKPKEMEAAEGGRIGFKGGGLTSEDYLKVKDMLNHWHDYKKGGGTMSKTNFGIAFFRENNAEGGRIGFSGGGMGRRGFLKMLAGLGGLTAAAKSGMIGLGEGGAKKAITETVKQTAPEGVPPYFLNLVKKIKTMGDDVTEKAATQDRQKVTKYKDYELTEDVATGKQEIQRMKVLDDDSADYYGQPLTEETYMSYTPGENTIGKGGKPVKTKPEYEEGTALLRSDRGNAGDIVDESFTVSDDVIKEGTMFEDTIAEFGKADGGRIGFDGGGSPLQRLRQEIVDSMKGYAPADVTEDQLQLVVKDITLDMTPEQAQASALSNFRKLFGMAKGGLAGMLGE